MTGVPTKQGWWQRRDRNIPIEVVTSQNIRTYEWSLVWRVAGSDHYHSVTDDGQWIEEIVHPRDRGTDPRLLRIATALRIPNPEALDADGLEAAILRRVEKLDRYAAVDTPETTIFVDGVQREALYQRERWGADDGTKSPLDWFGLVGFLGNKAVEAHMSGDTEKARHHTISTAAACANWHAAIAHFNVTRKEGV